MRISIQPELEFNSKNPSAIDVDCLHALTVSESDDEQLQLYQIEVKSQGHLVAGHVILASNALKAIALIESEYGDPIQAEMAEIENNNGRRHRIMIAKNWHGYTFDARVIDHSQSSGDTR